MRKKFLGVILAICLLVPCAFALSACGEHTHEYTAKFDSTAHWEECSCGEKVNIQNHTLTYTSTSSAESHIEKCSCGYQNEVDCDFTDHLEQSGSKHKSYCKCGNYKNQSHSYGNYIDDGETHVKRCACGKETGRQNHVSFTCAKIDNETHSKKCDACGHEFEAEEHVSYQLTEKDTYHCRVCVVCSAEYDIEEHAFGAWTNYSSSQCYRTCTCGRQEKEDHDFSAYTKVSAWTHKLVCSRCGEQKGKEENHDMTYVFDGDGKHHEECKKCDYKGSSEECAMSTNDNTRDENYHWKECYYCKTIFDKSPHEHERYRSGQSVSGYTEDDCLSICSCGMVLAKTAHDCEWHTDDNYHYDACKNCDYSDYHWQHNFRYEDLGDGTHKVTCSNSKCAAWSKTVSHWRDSYVKVDETSHKQKCGCGAVFGDAIAHNVPTEYTTTGEGHYKTCSDCHEKVGEEAHTFKYTKTSGVQHKKGCETCGYEVSEDHVFDVWKYNGKTVDGEETGRHHNECVCGALGEDNLKPCEMTCTQIDDEYHYWHCQICENAKEKVRHTYLWINDAGSAIECACGKSISALKISSSADVATFKDDLLSSSGHKAYFIKVSSERIEESIAINRDVILVLQTDSSHLSSYINFAGGLTVNGNLSIVYMSDDNTAKDRIYKLFGNITINGNLSVYKYCISDNLDGKTYVELKDITVTKENADINMHGAKFSKLVVQGKSNISLEYCAAEVENLNGTMIELQKPSTFVATYSTFGHGATWKGIENVKPIILGEAGIYDIKFGKNTEFNIYTQSNATIFSGNLGTEETAKAKIDVSKCKITVNANSNAGNIILAACGNLELLANQSESVLMHVNYTTYDSANAGKVVFVKLIDTANVQLSNITYEDRQTAPTPKFMVVMKKGEAQSEGTISAKRDSSSETGYTTGILSFVVWDDTESYRISIEKESAKDFIYIVKFKLITKEN